MDGIPKLMQAVLLKGHGGFEQLELRHDVTDYYSRAIAIPAAEQLGAAMVDHLASLLAPGGPPRAPAANPRGALA